MRLPLAFLLACLLSFPLAGRCQVGKEDSTADTQDLERMLDTAAARAPAPPARYTLATFKATRIINGHSIENLGAGALDFRIAHRFGDLSQGGRNFYGIDNAITMLQFDYGITRWLMIGLGRSTYQKEYDGYFKVKLLRQTNNNAMPISVSYLAGISSRTLHPVEVPGVTNDYGNRLCYTNQLLIARKACKWISIQLTPTYIHYNIVPALADANDVLACGFGARFKLSNRIALTGEYYYTLPGHKLSGNTNPVSMGVDIETGGHVFQLFFSNSAYISERAFIAETSGTVAQGNLHFGFNISRVFTIVKPKEVAN